MKSIKPGRKYSAMSAVLCIFAALFGVFWCGVAGSIGAWFMIPFGLFFIGFAVYEAVCHSHNAVSKNRYSVMDIVDSEEEPDPFDKKYVRQEKKESVGQDNSADDGSTAYCPYCGKPVESRFDFCPKCGKKLPD